jgi:hypothetical protein
MEVEHQRFDGHARLRLTIARFIMCKKDENEIFLVAGNHPFYPEAVVFEPFCCTSKHPGCDSLLAHQTVPLKSFVKTNKSRPA